MLITIKNFSTGLLRRSIGRGVRNSSKVWKYLLNLVLKMELEVFFFLDEYM